MKCKTCKKEIIPKNNHLKHKYIYCSKSCFAKDKFTIHNESKTEFYGRWRAIYRRCNDEKFISYENYGGKGIKCLWKDYICFKKDMYKSYLEHRIKFGKTNTFIDRIDNSGDYCKKNCKWSTRTEQNNNTSRNIKIGNLTVKEFSKKYGIKYSTLIGRISGGWKYELLSTKAIVGNRYKNINL